ncbi:hypothetical protein N0V94_004194 [Neodidymelliopsis sp. IMI 364377]|nr:hypothetical protein N0V94_004194 [Neodidymelliopsis sp. IMI 364377]
MQVAGSSEVLKDVYGKNTSPATSSGERNPAGSTQPESTMAALTEESTQKVVPKSDVAIQRPTFSLLEPATKSTPSPTAPTINTQADPDSNTVNNLTLPAEITLPSPTTLPTAKPYFEYSIHQTLSSSSASTPVPLSTELTAHPLTSPDAANAQLETLFHNTRDSFNLLDLQSTRTTHSFDEHGLATYEAAFTSIEDQSKVLGLKIWVSRNTVGVHANYTPSTFAHARLVSRTVYLLCLSRLVPAVPSSRTSRVSSPSYSSSSSSGDDNDDDNLTNPQTLRIHHPLPSLTAALHTTLDAANRAARRVQIALSHEREPRGMQVQWQTKDLQELDERLERLRRKAENDGAVVTEEQRADSDNIKEIGDGNATAKGCWISTFNGLGLGSDKFQLRIEAVRLVGPRNL